MRFLTKFADNKRQNSTVNKWRRERFKLFTDLIKNIPKPVKILDIGGTENFWIQMGYTDEEDCSITILNTEKIDISKNNFKYVNGDARNLYNFGNNEYDVIFSNSVIEHVGNFEDQKKMAMEITKKCKRFFIQTPNYYFPMEPHFLFPFFQFLPERIKIFMVMHLRLGWFEKCKSIQEAKSLVRSVRLLKKKELVKLFPGAEIASEKFFLFTKSFMVLKSL